jgi:hypothetical protein
MFNRDLGTLIFYFSAGMTLFEIHTTQFHVDEVSNPFQI